ncbi:MAG: hypothetical protein MJ119_03290 [Lachnospiraceae bacterium]|nr:hypothetical protein [Lachnospiraceae bacterium]
MKKLLLVPVIISCAAMAFLSGCNTANTASGEENTAASSAESVKASRDYFVNVDKSSSLDDVINSIGAPYETTGSGIIKYYWYLEEGGTARVIFDQDGIEYVSIHNDGEESEVLYLR